MKAKEKFIKYNFNGWEVNPYTERLTDLYLAWCNKQSFESLPHKKQFMDAETLLERGMDVYGNDLDDEQLKFLKGYIELFYQVQEWGAYYGN